MKNGFLQMQQKGHFERTVEIIIHVCVWTYIFASPLLTGRRGEAIDWITYFQRLYFPLSSCFVFYANYFYFVPRYLVKSKKFKHFIFYNILFVILLMMSREVYVMLLPPPGTHRHMRHAVQPPCVPFFFWLMFMCRNFLSLIFISFLAMAVRLSVQWRKAEVARQEAELGRSEAELKNLKNQINPHFLLNTLNNIYALTAFDPEKAQTAIQELSKLLRYVLYENQARFVDLKKEQDFLVTYISLMRIRLSSNVAVNINFNVPEGIPYRVAPLIFISLVENAFKHGVSPTQHSFIDVSLTVKDRHLHFSCRNSNFPKSDSDKSPGGIGLQQVSSRLEHSYPGRYEWRYGTSEDNNIYFSEIDIEMNEQTL